MRREGRRGVIRRLKMGREGTGRRGDDHNDDGASRFNCDERFQTHTHAKRKRKSERETERESRQTRTGRGNPRPTGAQLMTDVFLLKLSRQLRSTRNVMSKLLLLLLLLLLSSFSLLPPPTNVTHDQRLSTMRCGSGDGNDECHTQLNKSSSSILEKTSNSDGRVS